MLVKEIEPVDVPSKGIANCLKAYVVYYDLNGTCEVKWDAFNNGTGISILSGNLYVSPELVEIWGNDNACILQDVANQKGFVIIE